MELVQSPRQRIIIAGVLAALSSCTSTPPPEIPPSAPLSCTTSRVDRYEFWQDMQALKPGDEIQLVPKAWQPPGYTENMDTGCISAFLPIDPALASVERRDDGSYWLEVADDAPSKKWVAVEARLQQSDRTVTGGIYIYRPEEQPLVGFWHQEDPDGLCQPSQRIRELHFDPSGSFSVTWQPFETYKDYWGSYNLDKDTGQLDLRMEGGNHVPANVLSGRIDLEGNSFTTAGASFGGAVCAAPFTRYERGW